MQVLFYHSPDKYIWRKLVTFGTQGPFGHAELRFSDGLCFSSSILDGGTGFNKLDIDNKDWVILELDCPEDRIRAYCESKIGHKYDWLGIMGFVFGRDFDGKHRYYCSEICARALAIEGVIEYRPRISPNLLYWMLKRSGRVTKEIIRPDFMSCCI